MASRLLAGKLILAVDDDQDVLDIIRDELEDHRAHLDHVSCFEEALGKMATLTYDVVILDIMGVRGFELLEYARVRNTRAVMLTAHSLNPESLRKSIELGARAYLPKDQLGELAPFLEDVLNLSYVSAWKSLFARLGRSLGRRFGPEWSKTEEEFWARFQQDAGIHEATILRS
jgi:CheY-like chemotaxis protein